MEGHGWNVKSVTFSPDGQFIGSVGYGQVGSISATQSSLLLWNLENGSIEKSLTGHEQFIYKIIISGDGKYLAGGTIDKNVLLWKIPGGSIFGRLTGHSDAVTSVATSSDGSILASGGVDNTVRLWNLPDGKLIHILQGHKNRIAAMSFSPDGEMVVTGSMDGSVIVWDVNEGKILQSMTGHSGQIRTFNLSPDGKMLAYVHPSTNWGPEAYILDTENLSIVRTLEVENNENIAQVLFSPDSQFLAARYMNGIHVFQLKDWHPISTFRSTDIYDMDFSPDGEYLAYAQEFSVRKLRVSDGEITGQMDKGNFRFGFDDIDYSPDGRTIAAITAATIVTWNQEDGTVINTLDGCAWLFIKFSPDGKEIITASPERCPDPDKQPQKVLLWNFKPGYISWSEEREAVGFRTEFGKEGIAFSPISPIVAVADIYGDINLHDTKYGRILHTLSGHKSRINVLNFSSDGKILISGSADGTIRFWGLP